MPREDRRIIFSYNEVYKAVYALTVQKNLKKPPAGELKTVAKSEEDSNIIILHLENPQDADMPKRTVEYSRDFMAAALMLMCRGHGIPMPKKAQKSVVLGKDNLVLRVEI